MVRGQPDLQQKEAENYWVGNLKGRYDFVLKYLGGNSTSRGYTVHKFEDRKGRKFLTYNDFKPDEIEVSFPAEAINRLSGESYRLKTDDCFTCKATVIRHDINNFRVDVPFKETILNRVIFNELLGKKGIAAGDY